MKYTPHLALGLAFLGCAAPVDRPAPFEPPLGVEPDLPVAQPPYDELEANWKQRLSEGYVFVEGVGPYSEFGELLGHVLEEVARQGLRPRGAPFGLFYGSEQGPDSPSGRYRAGVAVAGSDGVSAPLSYAVLDGTTVVYGFVAGPYPQVPSAYPGLYAFVRRMNWVPGTPVREIYLVPPSAVDDWGQLVTEVQIPAGPGS